MESKKKKIDKKPEKTEVVSPEEIKTFKQVAPMLEMMSMTAQKGGIQPDIAKKISEKHIEKAMTLSEKAMDYTHQDKKYDRFMNIFYVIAFVGFLIFLVVYLSSEQDGLLKEIINYIVIGGGGAGIGYGYLKK